jgi:hypothetical protein
MAYPANLELDADGRVANWRPLVHWLLGLPHLIVANVLQQVGEVVAVISWFAIVFTGQLPAGLADFQCLVIRYNARALSYAAWLREGYPAFEFPMTPADPGTDPVRVDLQPALADRNRLTVGLRFIWVIPAAIYGALLAIVVTFALIGAFFAVLFTGRWPEGLRSFVVGSGRWFVRLYAYALLLTDEYPPFTLQ